jgi:CrcB protein
MNWLLVFIGGGIGSLCRYGISQFSNAMGWRFAISTLVSNVIATLILVLVWTWLLKRETDSTMWWSLLAVGLCGGFSTFSTFSLETVQLMRDGYLTYAIMIIVSNLFLCLGSVLLIAKWT